MVGAKNARARVIVLDDSDLDKSDLNDSRMDDSKLEHTKLDGAIVLDDADTDMDSDLSAQKDTTMIDSDVLEEALRAKPKAVPDVDPKKCQFLLHLPNGDREARGCFVFEEGALSHLQCWSPGLEIP